MNTTFACLGVVSVWGARHSLYREGLVHSNRLLHHWHDRF